MKRHLSAIFGLGLFALGALAGAPAADERMLARTIERSTPLVRDGQAAACLIHPAGADGRALAQIVQDAVRETTGVELDLVADDAAVPVVPAWPAAPLRSRPLIVIGNIHVNRTVIPLYGQLLAAEDAWYPGGNGYTLRTVVNPFGAGHNALLLGGSTPEGLRRAVAAFCATVRVHAARGQLTIPPLLTVALDGAADTSLTGAVADPRSPVLALEYQWTGNSNFLRAATVQFRAADYPASNAPAWNPDHYAKERAVRNLIALIQSGALTATEVEAIENLMLKGLHAEYNSYWIVHGASAAATRHQTCGMMAFFVTAEYLLNRARPNEAAARFLRRCVEDAHAFFHLFDQCYREEGNDNGSFDSNGPICRYALGYGNTAFFQAGAARLMAQRALMMTDNRGWFVAPGNYEDTLQGRTMGSVDIRYALFIPAFVYRDARLKGIIAQLPDMRPPSSSWGFSHGLAGGRYPLDDIPALAPSNTSHDVLSIQPLPAIYYGVCSNLIVRNAQSPALMREWAALVPLSNATEMICFRDGFGRDDRYLFLMGIQGGRLDSLSANAILRYMERGRLWLIAQTEQYGPYFRNALHIGRAESTNDLQRTYAGVVRLDGSAQFPEVAMSATTLPRCNGADWTRNVFWIRKGGVLVVDAARFIEEDDYDLTCTWRTLWPASLEGRHWRADAFDSRFEIVNVDAARRTSTLERPRTTEQMSVAPYVLREQRSLHAKTNDRACFRNLLFAHARDAAANLDARPVGDAAVLIQAAGQEQMLVGVAGATPFAAGGLRTDAALFYITPTAVRLIPDSAVASLDGAPLNGAALPAKRLEAALRALWEAAPAEMATTATPPAPPPPPLGLTPVWSYTVPAKLREYIGGISVSDPPSPDADRLFSRQTTLWAPRWSWPTQAVTIELDLGAVERVGEISIVEELNRSDKLPSRGTNTAASWTVTASNDRFRKDIRTYSLPVERLVRNDPPHVYKPSAFFAKDISRWSATEDSQTVTARYVRLPALDCCELALYRQPPGAPAFDYIQAADLNGDGTDELIAATECGDLIALDANGSVRWQYAGSNTIVTAMLAADLSGKTNAPLLYVGDSGWNLRAFDAEGKERLQAQDLKTNILHGLQGIYALGTVAPSGAKHLCLVIATGIGATCWDPARNEFLAIQGGGVACDVVLAGSSSAPGARYRTGTRNVWGNGWMRTLAYDPGSGLTNAAGDSSAPFGPGYWLALGFEFWPEAGAPEAWRDGLSVVVTRSLVSAYNSATPTSDRRGMWPAPGPIGAYVFANLDGRPGCELVVGRLDGFINVLDRELRLARAWATGGPVRALAVWPADGGGVVAAVADTLRFYDREGREIGRLPVAADHLVWARTARGPLLVAAGRDGTLRAWQTNGR